MPFKGFLKPGPVEISVRPDSTNRDVTVVGVATIPQPGSPQGARDMQAVSPGGSHTFRITLEDPDTVRMLRIYLDLPDSPSSAFVHVVQGEDWMQGTVVGDAVWSFGVRS